MKILIVEDHYKINELLSMFARSDGYQVTQTYDANDALKLLQKSNYDVIITDLMLPTMQGEELIQKIRMVSDIYIMVVSAKVDVISRIEVLRYGADDYITKPFKVEEIMAKLHNVEKRLIIQEPTVYSFYQGELKVSTLARTVHFLDQPLEFTKHEYDILIYLVQHLNQICTRDQIFAAILTNSNAYDRVIDAHVKNIRKKMKDESKNSRYIKTHYGVGYQFVGDADYDF